jgi:hypothetical protein
MVRTDEPPVSYGITKLSGCVLRPFNDCATGNARDARSESCSAIRLCAYGEPGGRPRSSQSPALSYVETPWCRDRINASCG